ncbi:MAG: PadR family transcriptional regulator [Lachnospiraceae bacterium]|nr:PadR family transcriptional regulator [Lachnospiraceae bacterium]
MDTQLKRGMLDICILSTLLEEDSYGYKIIKDLQPFLTISESTLYPILRRLESAGYLGVYSAEHNGRLRKYYRIFPPGEERIKEFLQEWQTMMSIYNYIEEEMKKHEERNVSK